MAISVSFFLVYSQGKIERDGLKTTPVSIRAQVRYTRSHLNWSIARRMGHDIHRVQFTTPVKAQPKHWADGRAKHTHPNATYINRLLDDIQQRAISLHAQYIDAGQFPDQQTMITNIMGDQTPMSSQSGFFSDFNLFVDYLTDKNSSREYISAVKRVNTLLRQFELETNYKVSYETINKTFLAKYATWYVSTAPVVSVKHDKERATQRHLKYLKSFLNHALSEGWTKEIVWRQITPKFKDEAFPVTLTAHEIQRLMDIREEQIPLRKTFRTLAIQSRDWFVFATQTALRSNDWRSDKFNIVERDNGTNIRFVQNKTKNPLEVPLSELAVNILKKYNFNMPTPVSHTGLINHLKILAQLAGINKHITTHTARRTFCTLQEKAGVPRAVIMRISGHREEAVYLRYIGVTFETNADMMRQANPEWFKAG